MLKTLIYHRLFGVKYPFCGKTPLYWREAVYSLYLSQINCICFFAEVSLCLIIRCCWGFIEYMRCVRYYLYKCKNLYSTDLSLPLQSWYYYLVIIFMFFGPHRSLEILVSRPETEPTHPGMKMWSLNHGITREVPMLLF